MKEPLRKTKIEELSTTKYKLKSPIKVYIYSEPEGQYRASAQELGMWVEGFGASEEDAIADLKEVILERRESLTRYSESERSEYARIVKRAFEQRLVRHVEG